MQEADLLVYESSLYRLGYQFIAGVDEAGRGALAGPVVASAVILPKNKLIPVRFAHRLRLTGLTDSKQLTELQRERFYAELHRQSFAIGVGIISNEDIDHSNILAATLKAMAAAISDLSLKPDYVLIDGNKAPVLAIPHKTIPKGDSRSISIAAASVVAKVTRDRLMCEFHEIYPQYGFNQHKGYPTRQHRAAIAQFGPCTIHRRSFKLLYNPLIIGQR
ncbi:TPA: ribonuclease HII [Candidatus Poribacteria bacterium]|nr:ribonuclease HII [Candidatus Poribacteria bacterium]